MDCVNCGEPLNSDGTKHHNDITFCAFVTADIRWNDWRTAKARDAMNKTALWVTNDEATLIVEALGQWAEEYATQQQHTQAMGLVARAMAIAYPEITNA